MLNDFWRTSQEMNFRSIDFFKLNTCTVIYFKNVSLKLITGYRKYTREWISVILYSHSNSFCFFTPSLALSILIFFFFNLVRFRFSRSHLNYPNHPKPENVHYRITFLDNFRNSCFSVLFRNVALFHSFFWWSYVEHCALPPLWLLTEYSLYCKLYIYIVPRCYISYHYTVVIFQMK